MGKDVLKTRLPNSRPAGHNVARERILRGPRDSLPTMFTFISGFKAELNMFFINLAHKNIDPFPILKDLKEDLNITTINCTKYEVKIRCLLQPFESRFQVFESTEQNLQIFC